jgi:hypothetical protein
MRPVAKSPKKPVADGFRYAAGSLDFFLTLVFEFVWLLVLA